MTFREKSAWLTIVVLTAVTGWYAVSIITQADGGAVQSSNYQGLAVVGAIAVTVLLAVGLAVVAGIDRARSSRIDDRATERDRSRLGRVVLPAGVVIATGLAMSEADHFWIAHVLAGGLVASELFAAASQIRTARNEA